MIKTIKPKQKVKSKGMLIGSLIGGFVPLIGIIAFYITRNYNLSFTEYLLTLKSVGIASPLLSLCVIPNLLAFFIFIWLDKLIHAKGVMLSTLLYAIAIFILKFF